MDTEKKPPIWKRPRVITAVVVGSLSLVGVVVDDESAGQIMDIVTLLLGALL